MKSMAFVSSDKFFSGDPDYDWMQSVVDEDAVAPGAATGPGSRFDAPDAASSPSASEPAGRDRHRGQTEDACGYDPVG